MALRMSLYPKFPTRRQPPNPTTPKFLSPTYLCERSKTQIRCSDGELASNLASNLAKEVEKMNSLLAQREEAMEKSRDLLFRELCLFLSMEAHEFRSNWNAMEDHDKSTLVKGFVSDWGVNFHPLSATSVKELIQQHLQEQDTAVSKDDSSSLSSLFPNLKKIMGFQQNK